MFVDNGKSAPFIGFNAPVPIDVDITQGIHRRWNVQSNKTEVEPYLFSVSLNTYLSEGDCVNAVYFVFVHSVFLILMPPVGFRLWGTDTNNRSRGV